MKQITIEVEGVAVTAKLNDEVAPKVVGLVWRSLPLTAPLRHARWSGSAAYLSAPELRDPALAPENRVSFPRPGTLCLLASEGEIMFAYGGECQARTRAGNVWVSHFGEIEGDTTRFFALLAETQSKGRKTMTIRSVEG
ncbi:MAG TPA: DUF3830 family protein [Candidatus Limnocylindria bacterium]|jgi:hypothetical protein|nr:DUF3830 family protein [Candidatus Limnocylindria bacterium]